MHGAFIALLLVLSLVGALAVVETRDPARQAVVAGAQSLILALGFTALAAPDVAIAELVVGGMIAPLLTLLALAKARTWARERELAAGAAGGSSADASSSSDAETDPAGPPEGP